MSRRQYMFLVVLVPILGLINCETVAQTVDLEAEPVMANEEVIGESTSFWENVAKYSPLASAILTFGLVITGSILCWSTKRYSDSTRNLVKVTEDYTEVTRKLLEAQRMSFLESVHQRVHSDSLGVLHAIVKGTVGEPVEHDAKERAKKDVKNMIDSAYGKVAGAVLKSIDEEYGLS